MDLKLGDLVIRKDKTSKLLFQITEFDGDKVVIKGVQVPVITIADANNLIKLNRKRKNVNPTLRRIK